MENQIKEQAINVNIASYTGEKPVEVIIRKGEAAKAADPLATKAPIAVDFAGTLSSVAEWLSKRVSEIDQKQAHLEVDREKNTIKLVINESDAYTRGEILGTIAFTDEFVNTGINSSKTAWEPNKLGQYFRLNRAMFANKEDAMLLVSKLKNFIANAKSEIQKQKDPSGSRADVYRSEVESNLPKSFTLRLAIIKGMAKVDVEVEFDHYLSDGDCFLQLVSPGCKEAVDEYTDKCIDTEIEKIKELAPEIAILEK